MVLQGVMNNGNRSHSDAYYLSDQGTFTPVGAQGGLHRTPLKKTTFPPEFRNEIWNLHYVCMDYKKSQFCKKKKKKKWKCCTVSKWQPNNRFFFCVISILAKIWKTTFRKEFVNEIWLKVGEHEYIYTLLK